MFQKQKIQINYGLLLATTALLLCAVAVLFLLQRYQHARTVDRLDRESRVEIANKDYQRATKSLEKLMLFRPQVQSYRIEYAECFDQIASEYPEFQRSIGHSSAALVICQSDEKFSDQVPLIRKRLLKRFMQTGRYEDAIEQIIRLVGATVDLDLQRNYCLSKTHLWLEQRSFQSASGVSAGFPNWFATLFSMPPVDLLVKTHVEIPDDFDVAGLLVELCLGDPAKLSGSFLAGESRESLKNRAQGIVERLVAKRPQDPLSWLLRYEVSSRDSKLGLSEQDIERAVELSVDDGKILLIAGKLYLERAKRVSGVSNRGLRTEYLQRSLELLESSQKSNPKVTQTYLNMGDVYVLLGEPDKAVASWVNGKRVCDDRVVQLEFKIADYLIGLNRLDDALDALESMDRTLSKELTVLNRYEQSAFTRQSRECWARYYLAIGNFQKAANRLQGILASGKELDSVNQAATYAALGDCYRQVGQYDLAASTYEQAVLISPSNNEFRRRAAAAWFSAGRPSEAYKHFLLVEPKEATDWIQICDIILEIQRQNGQDTSYWFTFDKGVAETKRLIAFAPDAFRQVWLLEVMQLDASIMRVPESTRPSSIEFAAGRLWEIVLREDFESDVLRAAIVRWNAWNQKQYLAQTSQALLAKSGDNTTPLRKAELLSFLGNESQALEILENQLKTEPENQSIQDALKRIELTKLPTSKAIQEIRELKKGGWFSARNLAWSTLKRPIDFTEEEIRNPVLQAKRIDARLDELRALEELLKDFEGPEGTEWRYIKGRRLLVETTDIQKLNSIELLDLAGNLDRKRPEWPETHILAGLIAESQNNRVRAIREYNYAIQYGNKDIDTYERLVNLLYQQGLLADARIVLDRLGYRAYMSRSLAAISLQMASEKPDDQLAAAQQGTKLRPKDPMAWIWLAQTIELQSREQPEDLRAQAIQKAQDALNQAADLTPPTDLRVEMARFNFYQATQNSQGQQKILDEILQNKRIDPATQLIAVGQIHEAFGHMDPAIENYRKAISLGNNELELRTRITGLLVKDGRLEEAIKNLQETMQRYPQDSATRRRLATLLASRSLDEDWQQIAELLSPSEQSKSPEDVRLQVMLLSQKSDLTNLQTAQALLERILELPGVRTDEDHFQLASLYMRSARLLEQTPGRELEALQTEQAAGRMLKTVASGPSPKPEYIYTYADYLIRQKRFFDAVEESQKLDAIATEAFPTVLLRARIAKIEGNQQAAKNTILAWLEEKRQLHASSSDRSKLASYLVQAGQAMEILQEREENRKLLKEAYDLDKRAGVNYIRSILLTEDQTTRNNAVRFMMDRLKSEASGESAVLLSLLVRKGDTDEDLISAAQKQLVDYSISQKDDRKILQSLADLWIWKGNESQAIETFRRIVQDRPNDVIALNNLAILLADSPANSQEALPLINRAIELVGTKPALMDSKAYVLLRLGRYDEAISILSALRTKNDSPSVRFHLYQAYSKSSQTQLANELLTTIDLAALRKSPLTQSDQKVLQQIEKATSKELQ
jgi:tetratricopeptide (TPR) repeat protein